MSICHDTARASDVLDDLFERHPAKVEQARTRPGLVGWFVGQTMRRMNGEGCAECIGIEVMRRLDGLNANGGR